MRGLFTPNFRARAAGLDCHVPLNVYFGTRYRTARQWSFGFCPFKSLVAWKCPPTQGSGKALSQRIEPFYVQLQQLQLVFLPLRIQQFCKSTVLTTTSSNLVLLQLRILQSFGDKFKKLNKETAI